VRAQVAHIACSSLVAARSGGTVCWPDMLVRWLLFWVALLTVTIRHTLAAVWRCRRMVRGAPTCHHGSSHTHGFRR